MKKHLFILSISICFLCTASAAIADVKVKTKQTISGQSYENTTYIKGKRSRSENMGGAMISITQCDLKRGIQINPAAKTFMINEFVQAAQSGTSAANNSQDSQGVVRSGGKVTTTITAKDTGERKQMFGYTAKHLIITMETVSSPDACSPNNSKMEMDGWYIDAEFALDCDLGYQAASNPYGRKGGCQDKYEMKQVGTVKRGYPVYEKMTMYDQSGKETFATVNEVVELSKATLDAGLFEIPSDYRQVSDSTQLYASVATSYTSTRQSTVSSATAYSDTAETGAEQVIRNSAQSRTSASAEVTPKKAGVIRIGLSPVKTGAVGDGVTAADLAAAVQNTLTKYLKAPNIEVVLIDAKLPSLIDGEARQKECDYVIFANVSHKKGGGGFGGMFGNALESAVGRVGIGQTGSVAGNLAGQVATQAIVSATTVSANVKAKDQVTFDLKLQQTGGPVVVAKQFTAKAKSNGDDIISQVVESAAQAIVEVAGK
jgi:hypothetical protein